MLLKSKAGAGASLDVRELLMSATVELRRDLTPHYRKPTGSSPHNREGVVDVATAQLLVRPQSLPTPAHSL